MTALMLVRFIPDPHIGRLELVAGTDVRELALLENGWVRAVPLDGGVAMLIPPYKVALAFEASLP